jgi:hypothetical protein
MFTLTGCDLAGRTLGCGDGPASFNAEATSAGHAVVSCDPIYAFSADDIRQRVEACYDDVISQANRHPEWFVWDFFHDPNELGRHRLAAMDRFLGDFERGKREGRYVAASLPALPFADAEFGLALVSQLLFLYTEQLDLATHTASIFELLRVANEVRIFPLVRLDRRWSPHVEPVRRSLEAAGYAVEIVATAYEFQRAEGHAGNRIMRVVRRVPRLISPDLPR